MKKVISVLLASIMVLSLLLVSGCGETNSDKPEGETKTYDLAVVTDVGQLMDGGFNQGTYEGVKAYAEANNITYNYYQPANGSDATDNDRIAAMRQAIKNGAKVIVAPGFLQATAMTTVALESPEVKFVFVDGWSLTDNDGNLIPNVTAIIYKEQESGYLAGYAAVKDGYKKLGGTFGGGGSNPACNRFAYGYVQGAVAAAKELDTEADIRISFLYGDAFSASPELQTQMASWYTDGLEVIFACGGSMVNSVIAAATEVGSGKIIGVDTDQSGLSDAVITSATKGLATSVKQILTQFYAGEWDAKLSGQTSNLGAADDGATCLPIQTSRFNTFTQADYEAIFNKIANGEVKPDDQVDGITEQAFWDNAAADSKVKVTLEK